MGRGMPAGRGDRGTREAGADGGSLFLPPPVLHDVEKARARPALRNGGRGAGSGEEGEGEGPAPSLCSAPRTQKAAGKTRRAAGGAEWPLRARPAPPALAAVCGSLPAHARGVPVPSTASPCPAPHPRARGPVPVSGGAGGARPAVARRDGSVGLSTAQLTAPPSSRHRRAQLSIGCRRYRDSRPCVPRDLLGQPRCGGREHAVSPGTGRFCAGLFV